MATSAWAYSQHASLRALCRPKVGDAHAQEWGCLNSSRRISWRRLLTEPSSPLPPPGLLGGLPRENGRASVYWPRLVAHQLQRWARLEKLLLHFPSQVKSVLMGRSQTGSSLRTKQHHTSSASPSSRPQYEQHARVGSGASMTETRAIGASESKRANKLLKRSQEG